MNTNYYSENQSKQTLGRQKLSYSRKDTTWRRGQVDAVINTCNTYAYTRRSSAKNKKRNYDLFNNKINRLDFNHVTNPFGLSDSQLKNMQMPATLQPYDVVSSIFMLLLGEESAKPFNPIVVATNETAVSAKLQQKKDTIIQALSDHLKQFLDPNQDNPTNDEIMKQLTKYSKYSPKDLREVNSQHLLNYLTRHLDLYSIFQEGYKDALLSSEEIYDIVSINGFPMVRKVNPLEVSFILPNNSNVVDEADLIYEKNRMSISQIIDEFYEQLSPGQIDDLENAAQGASTAYNYGETMMLVSDIQPAMQTGIFPEVNSIFDMQDFIGQTGIVVHRVRWKSKRKVGILHYLDENYQEQKMIVSEDYEENKDNPDQFVEWFWVNEYWEGIRIGTDMYLDIKPRKNQYRSIDNMSKCKSGYVGTVYSATNAQAVSLMDRLVPWIFLYLIIWYRTELLIAANQGKIARIDLAEIPAGWTIEKWLYYASAMKFAFVDSFNEGMKGAATGKLVGQMNRASTTPMDLETGNSIQYNIQLLQFIEQKIEDTSGVTKQRKGEIQASELVGNTERSVMQSSHITEEYTRVHNNVKKRVLECLIKEAQECIAEKSLPYTYISDDMQQVFGEMDGNEMLDADLGIFIGDTKKDAEILKAFQDNLQAALQNDQVSFSQIADVIGSNSIAELKNKLKEAEEQRMQQQQQQQQNELTIQKQMHDEQQKLAYDTLDREDNNKQLDRENKLEIAEINTYIGQDTLDQDNNGIPDPIELLRVNLEKSQLEFEKLKESKKLNLESKKIDAENQRTKVEQTMQDKDHKHEKELEKIKGVNQVKAAKAKPRPKPASKK